MLSYALAVGSVAALCGLWVVVQRWVADRDPDQPGVEGHRHCKASGPDCADSACGSCSVDLGD